MLKTACDDLLPSVLCAQLFLPALSSIHSTCPVFYVTYNIYCQYFMFTMCMAIGLIFFNVQIKRSVAYIVALASALAQI